jgi:hypothetical protein
VLTAREANEHHVECNRDDRDGLVDLSSVISTTGVNSGITKSAITYSPLFERAKHINDEQSAAEYKIAASTNTRNKGIFPFVVRIPETLRSLIQMR